VKGLCRALVCLAIAALLAARPAEVRAASDPALRWYTIVTPHFRITYHSGVEDVAQHVATIAENIHESMVAHVGWRPGPPTEVVLTDTSEAANGSAGALPYNAVRLIVTAPEDMSPLGDVDDWYLELMTHEYTHVLHTDNIRGLPALVNAVLGKTLAPNQVQPRWILEGLAVYHESARTSGGRMRSSMWDMFLRADMLENNVASIDQISSFVRRWPQGNLFYLYGSYFTQWIAETHGEEALRETATDYGKQLIPWGFNRSMRRATGETYVEMYPSFVEAMKKRFRAQAAEVRARGQREGVQLTHHGQVTRYPRWIPGNAWKEHEGGLLYYREDQHLRQGLWAIDLSRDSKGAIVRSGDKTAEHIARTSSESYASFLPDGSVVFSSQDFYKNVFFFGDLEKLPAGSKSSYGPQDGGRVQLTKAIRAADPATSPDGRRVVFTMNRSGVRSIHIAELEDEGIANARPLVPTAWLEQAFTPRWSPDGTHVAYSVWKRGGRRDIRYVDVRDGTFKDITSDRAVDGAPSFSPDGAFLFFHSDRTGIQNVYAWDIAKDRLLQVTNVINGAYEPEPSPDGKTLAYVGYTKKGYDLFAMPLDPATWTEAEPYVDRHPPAPEIPQRQWEVRPYDPWTTLWPRRYAVQITEGSFGRVLNLSVVGTDIAGLHTIAATSTTELEKPELQGALSYTYGRLPFDVGVSLFRSITPRGGYALGKSYAPTIVQENTGFSSSIAYTRPGAGAVDTSSYVLSHSIGRVGAELPFPRERLDPFETPQIPPRGLQSSVHLGYAFTNAERYTFGVGPERGFSLNTGFDLTHPGMGSDFEGFVTDGNLTAYWLMPWLSHHSLASHVGGGTSGGSFPGRGAFYVGSFVELPLVDVLRNTLIQGGITLRGYEPVAIAGRSYLLSNLEYRFPIWNVDRGPSTLPFLFNRVSGAFFVDYGTAFDQLTDARWKTGVGSELWFESTFGYLLNFNFRLGYARGLASGGIDKLYFIAAVPF
jgi:Omp85 superfamily domain/WD40-like Beta Propeller Repeat